MRVSEVYASVQGEGPRVGTPTVFLRFGGCNLRCPGWPCDTQHAIDPKYRKEWVKLTPNEVTDWAQMKADEVGTRSITFTGGEPFLQRGQDELLILTGNLTSDGYDVECFSNGTIVYPDWAYEMIDFIMDWKLPGSGEDPHNAVRLNNIVGLSETDAIKFVCNDMRDIVMAMALWTKYIEDKVPAQVYYGKVWEGNVTDDMLIDFVMKNQLPWKLNMQMHNYVWPANERGR